MLLKSGRLNCGLNQRAMRTAATAPYHPDQEESYLVDLDFADPSTLTLNGDGRIIQMASKANGQVFMATSPIAYSNGAATFDFPDAIEANTRFGLSAAPDLCVLALCEEYEARGGSALFQIGSSVASTLIFRCATNDWSWRYLAGAKQFKRPTQVGYNVCSTTRPEGGDQDSPTAYFNGQALAVPNPASAGTPDNTAEYFKVVNNWGVRLKRFIAFNSSNAELHQRVVDYMQAL